MYFLVIGLSHLLCLTQCHNLLLLIEVLYLEFVLEFKDLLRFTLSLRSLTDILSKTFVEVLKIFLLLSTGHKEKRWQLGIFLLECLSLLGRQHLYVISNTEILLLLIHFHDLFLLQLFLNF